MILVCFLLLLQNSNQRQLGEERVSVAYIFQVTVHCGKPRQEPETGAVAEVIEIPFSGWLPRLTFGCLFSVFQEHLPRDGTTAVNWTLPRQS